MSEGRLYRCSENGYTLSGQLSLVNCTDIKPGHVFRSPDMTQGFMTPRLVTLDYIVLNNRTVFWEELRNWTYSLDGINWKACTKEY